jgi:hypothetical protein
MTDGLHHVSLYIIGRSVNLSDTGIEFDNASSYGARPNLTLQADLQ